MNRIFIIFFRMFKSRQHYPQGIFHIYNRGSKKEAIFMEDIDYSRFLQKLKKYSDSTEDKILQYCLLPNHFHILIQANSNASITKLMLKLQTSHARYFVFRYNFVGRVFQHRYGSVVINDTIQLKTASRYIHRNPIDYFKDELLCKYYKWSSYRLYLNNIEDELITKDSMNVILSNFNSHEEYIDFIDADEIVFQKLIKSIVSKSD